MTPELATEYRKLRKRNPRLPAKQAILWAKGNLKPLELDWDTFTGRHFATAKTKVVEGYDIRVTVDYDEYPESRVTFTDENTGIRNPRYTHHDGWARRTTGSDKRFISLESDETVASMAKYFRKVGMSKSVAWDEARKSLEDEARMYLGDDYVQVNVTATAYIDGIEVGQASIGTDFDIEYGSIERELDNAVIETGVIFEAIEEAKSHLATVMEAERKRLARMEALTV